MPSHTDVVLEVIIGSLPSTCITAIKTFPDAVEFYWGFSRWRVDLNLKAQIIVGGSLREPESSRLMGLLLQKEWELRNTE